MTENATVFQIGDFATSLETGWLGKVVAFEDHNGDRFAKMIGFDRYARVLKGMAIDDCLCHDDVQWFAPADLVADDREGLAREVAIQLSGRNPHSPVRVYQWPWGAYLNRFDKDVKTEIDGYPVRHVATYRNTVDVLAGWGEV